MKFAVIGSGAAGCSAAYTLQKQGHQVDIFESSDSIGGRTKQITKQGFNLPSGALFLMEGIYPRASALIREMGHENELIPWAGATQLVDRDDSRYAVNLVKMPSYLSLPVLSFGDKVRLALAGLKLLMKKGPKNPFDGKQLAQFDKGENMEDWSRQTLGDRAYEYIINPMMNFLTAAPSRQLATGFPLSMMKKALSMKLSVPPGGMGQISDWFIEDSPNATFHFSSKVEKIEANNGNYKVFANGVSYEVNGVIVATEAFAAADILKPCVPDSAIKKLQDVPYGKYATVSIAYKKNPWPDFPADLVLPVGDNLHINCLLLNSRRHPGSVPPGGELATVIFNVAGLSELTDDQIKQEALEAVSQVFGKAPDPLFVHLFCYERGVSIPGPGICGSLESIHDDLPRGIAIAGDYFASASVETAVSTGEAAAIAVHKALSEI